MEDKIINYKVLGTNEPFDLSRQSGSDFQGKVIGKCCGAKSQLLCVQMGRGSTLGVDLQILSQVQLPAGAELHFPALSTSPEGSAGWDTCKKLGLLYLMKQKQSTGGNQFVVSNEHPETVPELEICLWVLPLLIFIDPGQSPGMRIPTKLNKSIYLGSLPKSESSTVALGCSLKAGSQKNAEVLGLVAGFVPGARACPSCALAD